MNWHEFQALWCAEKSIVEEVRFIKSGQFSNVYEFDKVPVLAAFPSEVWASGTYECKIQAVRYTFHVEGIGPILRYCMGGTTHGNAGRFHYHEMRSPEEAKRNLPHAVPRLDMRGMSAKQVWHQICREGKITHSDTFYEPERLCR